MSEQMDDRRRAQLWPYDDKRCARCGNELTPLVPGELEAMDAEYLGAFGPAAENEPRAIVCDACWLIMCPGGKPLSTS